MDCRDYDPHDGIQRADWAMRLYPSHDASTIQLLLRFDTILECYYGHCLFATHLCLLFDSPQLADYLASFLGSIS